VIIFHRVNKTQLYTADVSPADHGELVYLFPQDVTPPEQDMPATDLWNNWEGYFLFLAALPPDINSFIAKLYQVLPTVEHASLGWIEGKLAGDFSVLSLEIKAGSDGPATVAVDFTFQQLIFRIGRDQPVARNKEGDGFQMTNLGQRTQIISQASPFQPVNISQTLALPLTGASRGAFSAFQISLNVNQVNPDGLDVACFYFYPEQNALHGIAKLRCPIFNLKAKGSSSSLNLEGSLFPSNWDDSFFSFIVDSPPSLGSYFRTTTGYSLRLAPAPATKLIFTQRPGDTLTENIYYYLTPEGDFILQADDAQEGAIYDLLCGLQGTEYISFQPQTGSYTGDCLRFTSRRPAYAPNYPFQQASPVGPPSDPQAKLLDASIYTTAWATVVRAPASSNGSIPYVAQPKGASLYGLDGLINKNHDTLYGAKDPSVVLPDYGLTFPLPPYAGVTPDNGETTFSAEQIEDFERQVIGPTRRQAIGAATRSAAPSKQVCIMGHTIDEDSSPYNATTPSGLIATVGADGVWTKILLGQNLQPTRRQLYFCNPDDALRQAFQTNQLFLVVANKDKLGTLAGTGSGDCGSEATFYNQMNVENWQFEADVGQTNKKDPQSNKYGNYYNVIIIKGRQGKLYDPPPQNGQDVADTVSLVANPDKWTQRQTFAAPATVDNNQPDPNQLVILSQWLQSYFQEAREQPDDEYFKKFNAIAKDENWTGILVLRMKVADLPNDLAGITAGITASDQFNVHHFAIEISQVANQPGQQPALKDTSSMFGLIYYVDPDFKPSQNGQPVEPVPPAAGLDYDFQLLSLKVLFENSAVKDFHSYAQITLNTLFDMPVTRMGQGGNPYNTIVLRGSYQNNNGQPVYSLGSTSNSTFYFDNNVINKIEITSAQMTTRNSGSQGTVVSWFGFSGFIDYKIVYKVVEDQVEKFPFDVFSFGNEANQDQLRKGLSFSNLGLQMSFPTDEPMQRELAFVSDNIRFDMATSTPRDNSLFINFALELQGLDSGTQDASPSKDGYLTVITDARLTGVDGGPWYGLRYQLNMGTPGDLAGKVNLTSYLLMAWAPDSSGEGSYKALVGLELPGTGGGAKLISLQNVLKLSIGHIRLTYDKNKNSFLLMLTEIALKFLGLLKIPPSGSTLFYLFGNPESGGKASGLGWYAMYRQKKTSSKALTS